MSQNKKESFFWTSYSDLMTSLFFVMLVLFVLTVGLLHQHIESIRRGAKANQEQIDKIEEIQNATENINRNYFEYRPEYKKHVLKISVQFPKGDDDISKIGENTKSELLDAGNSLRDSINAITNKFPKIQYLLIIEGQASRDNYPKNYELSYRRALALKRYWENEGIDFGKSCEVLIAGSGDGKLSGTDVMRESEETKNQRFLIHIVPKAGMLTK